MRLILTATVLLVIYFLVHAGPDPFAIDPANIVSFFAILIGAILAMSAILAVALSALYFTRRFMRLD